MLDTPFDQGHHAVSDRDATTSLGEVLPKHGVFDITAEESDRAGAILSHRGGQRIIRLQDPGPPSSDGIDHRSLHLSELFKVVDEVQAKVVPFADVGDNSDVAIVESKPFAKDTAARGFKNRGLDPGIGEDRSCALRT